SFASRVDAVDFGEDIGLSGETNYGLALLRDHRDKASWDDYNQDPHHFRVGGFIDAMTREEITARADYLYTGPASVQGRVRPAAPAYRQASALLAALTRGERTAQIQHRMKSG